MTINAEDKNASSIDEPALAVLHLVRKGNPSQLLKRFIKSYQNHPTEMNHRLIFILKGFSGVEAEDQKRRIVKKLRHAEFVEVSDDGFDINAYRDAAQQIDCEYLLFLNSYSSIEADQWLEKFTAVFQKHPTAGLVGATGNWEITNDETPFPNVHIRSNGFMIRRDIFLNLTFGALDTKKACSQFEAGKNSMTRQILALNLELYIVGRNGHVYPPQNWPESGIFRSGEQENLLIADNRTREHTTESPRHRLKMARLSWGDQTKVPPPSFLRSVVILFRRLIRLRF